MTIKGTDLAKKLPEGEKKNCRECGLPTCFAFAMKLASGGIGIEKCPYVSVEIRREIEEILTPAIKRVTVGVGEKAVTVGEEEVMYRHEKSFYREPGIAILISDKENEVEIDHKLEQIRNSVFRRGQALLRPNLLAIKFDSKNRNQFEAVVRKVHSDSDLTAMILSEELDTLFWARDVYKDRNPLIYPITRENIEQAALRIKEVPTVVGVKGEGVEGIIPLTQRLKDLEIKEIMLDPSSSTFLEAIQDQTIIRRATLKQAVRPLGYPTLAFPCFLTEDSTEEALYAAAFVAKYAGLIVISNTAREYLFPLLVQRMDIYSDPRKLKTVEAKIYEINQPEANSPVLLTTNFALTYFTVSSEVESSRVPAFLAVLDTGGMGVQTAMGAGKFDADQVAEFIKKSGLDLKMKIKHLIIPWVASRLKYELDDALPGWEIFIGPKAINQLPAFLTEKMKEWGLKSRG